MTDAHVTYLRGVVDAADTELTQNALTLIRAMVATSMMKPMDFADKTNFPQAPLDLYAHDVTSIIMRPWLVITKAFQKILGTYKYPVQGLPHILECLDSFLVVVAIPMRNLLGKGLSMESMDHWFAEETGIAADVCRVFTLARGDVVRVPFGWHMIWCFAPSSGSVDKKAEKALKGKFFIQWELANNPKIQEEDRIVKTHLEQECTKIILARGAQPPFSDYMPAVKAWVESVTVV